MSTRRWMTPVVVGECRFESPWFSNRWTLFGRGDLVIAELRRDPSRMMSQGVFADGTRFELVPEGWGTVVFRSDDGALGRIDRRSWWGRRWDISGTGFACELTSDPLPRRWTFRIGGEPIGRLAGTLVSYNRMEVQADISIPVHALILGWQVLARPWEQAAAPRTLVPDRPA